MAKAVRIRILSGGQEHTSLDTLLTNFNVNDVLKLLDGRKENGIDINSRLERWLRQIQEEEKAKKIHDLNQSQESSFDILELLKIFFPHIIDSDMIEIAKKWINDDKYKRNGEYLFEYLVNKKDSNAILCLIENDIHLLNIDFVKLLSLLEELGETDSTGNIQFVVGQYYYDGIKVTKDFEKGVSLIRKSSEKNNNKASAFINKEFNNPSIEREHSESTQCDFDVDLMNINEFIDHIGKNDLPFNTKECRDKIFRKCTGYFPDLSINVLYILTRNCKSIFLDFLYLCKCITESGKIDDVKRKSIDDFCNNGVGNIRNVAKFIVAINLDNDSEKYKNALIQLNNCYDPASYLIAYNCSNNCSNNCSDNIKYKTPYFYKRFFNLSCSNFECMNFVEKVNFIIKFYCDYE